MVCPIRACGRGAGPGQGLCVPCDPGLPVTATNQNTKIPGFSCPRILPRTSTFLVPRASMTKEPYLVPMVAFIVFSCEAPPRSAALLNCPGNRVVAPGREDGNTVHDRMEAGRKMELSRVFPETLAACRSNVVRQEGFSINFPNSTPIVANGVFSTG